VGRVVGEHTLPAVGGSHQLEGNLLVAVEVDTQTHLADPGQIRAKCKMEE